MSLLLSYKKPRGVIFITKRLGRQGAKEIFSAVYTEALSLVASPAANLLSNGTKLKVLKPFFQNPKYVRKERLKNLY